ncbi:MAG: ParB/RepB/Spo0J family partition protein, partial [Sphingobacteriales bacterium]
MTYQKKTGLGRGLSALLNDSEPANAAPKPQSTSAPTKADNTSPGNISAIKLEQIEVNPFQPRTEFDPSALNELAESIQLQGLIQPITVRKVSENSYQLISGERRLRASKIAGLPEIPAYIRTANDQQMLEMALIENIQRENLNAIEVALSFQRMIDECS